MIWTVKCLRQIWNSFRSIYSLYWIKFVKYKKLFKIQGTGCYDTNFTFISTLKDGLQEFELWHVSRFSCTWKKDSKVFGKNTVTFWHNFGSYGRFVCFSLNMTILTNSLWKLFKVLDKKMQKATLCVLRL